MVPGGLALAVWLLIRGVDVPKWEAKAKRWASKRSITGHRLQNRVKVEDPHESYRLSQLRFAWFLPNRGLLFHNPVGKGADHPEVGLSLAGLTPLETLTRVFVLTETFSRSGAYCPSEARPEMEIESTNSGWPGLARQTDGSSSSNLPSSSPSTWLANITF